MYNGIINVYKEAGFTSFDVIAKLRGILGQKKLGHTGTLDPAAVGVLPVCLGNGTKLVDMITDHSKEYRAVVLLGQATDTEDTTGTVTAKKDLVITPECANELTERIYEVSQKFVGGYTQVPPMYSAIKQDGRRLYELARQGVEVERKGRWVDIYEIEIESVNLPYFTMRVHCGKGTYIRSLCRDMGNELGTLACMDKLTRTRVGQFSIDKTLTLADIEKLRKEEKLEEHIIPVDDMFSELSAIFVPQEYEKLIVNGNKLPVFVQDTSEQVRVYYNNKFYGIYRIDDDRNYFVPVKMFACGGND